MDVGVVVGQPVPDDDQDGAVDGDDRLHSRVVGRCVPSARSGTCWSGWRGRGLPEDSSRVGIVLAGAAAASAAPGGPLGTRREPGPGHVQSGPRIACGSTRQGAVLRQRPAGRGRRRRRCSSADGPAPHGDEHAEPMSGDQRMRLVRAHPPAPRNGPTATGGSGAATRRGRLRKERRPQAPRTFGRAACVAVGPEHRQARGML